MSASSSEPPSIPLSIEEAYPWLGKEPISDEVFNICLARLTEWREGKINNKTFHTGSFGVIDCNLKINSTTGGGCHAGFGILTEEKCLAGFSFSHNPDILPESWCDYILNKSFLKPLLAPQMTTEIYKNYGLIYDLNFDARYIQLLNILSRVSAENTTIPASFDALFKKGFPEDFCFFFSLFIDASSFNQRTISHGTLNIPVSAKEVVKVLKRESGLYVPSDSCWNLNNRGYQGVGALCGQPSHYSPNIFYTLFKTFLERKKTKETVKKDPFGRKPTASNSVASLISEGVEDNLSYVANSLIEWIKEETGFDTFKECKV